MTVKRALWIASGILAALASTVAILLAIDPDPEPRDRLRHRAERSGGADRPASWLPQDHGRCRELDLVLVDRSCSTPVHLRRPQFASREPVSRVGSGSRLECPSLSQLENGKIRKPPPNVLHGWALDIFKILSIISGSRGPRIYGRAREGKQLERPKGTSESRRQVTPDTSPLRQPDESRAQSWIPREPALAAPPHPVAGSLPTISDAS
jgi:hypothetical protein